MAARTALHEADPAAGEEFDERMIALGVRWLIPRLVIQWDDDDLLTPAQAAEAAGVAVATISALRRRGRLAGTKTPNGWRYRAGDVYELAARPRWRQATATVTLPANGSSVPDGRTP
jgi:Helix-turn-helix domain